ncbi:MAG: hypothetical protein AAF959_08460 [Cyanobacteria bacterium P01_D01_bin.56]
MKRWFVGLSALALMGAAPLVGGEPVRAQLIEVKEAIVESIFRPEVKLTLGAEKQVVKKDAQGFETKTWDVLEGRVTVEPGDVLRYTVDGSNSGDVDAANLQITQPIPANTLYSIGSATGSTEITYSIDNGKSFVVQPMVEVPLPDGTVKLEPAPAEAYTHVQWSFGEALGSAENVKVSYEVTVQ